MLKRMNSQLPQKFMASNYALTYETRASGRETPIPPSATDDDRKSFVIDQTLARLRKTPCAAG
jgi:hypothetical protein